MRDSTARDIHDKVADWLAASCDTDQLKDWIVSVSWNIAETGDADAIHAAYEVVYALALYDDDQKLDLLRYRLRPLETDFNRCMARR